MIFIYILYELYYNKTFKNSLGNLALRTYFLLKKLFELLLSNFNLCCKNYHKKIRKEGVRFELTEPVKFI